MTRWKKDTREFRMNVNHNGRGTHTCRIPKPLMEMLGYPKTVRFAIKGKKVVFSPGDEE